MDLVSTHFTPHISGEKKTHFRREEWSLVGKMAADSLKQGAQTWKGILIPVWGN